METPKSGIVRVTDIMREIWEQVSPTVSRRASYTSTFEHSSVLVSEVSRLESFVESVRLGATQVGSMPPMPSTIRGWLGARLVAIVRRILFWYTPQLHDFNLKVATALTEEAKVTQMLLDELQELHAAVAELKRSVAGISENVTPAARRSSSDRNES
jgi:hypothetical protein